MCRRKTPSTHIHSRGTNNNYLVGVRFGNWWCYRLGSAWSVVIVSYIVCVASYLYGGQEVVLSLMCFNLCQGIANKDEAEKCRDMAKVSTRNKTPFLFGNLIFVLVIYEQRPICESGQILRQIVAPLPTSWYSNYPRESPLIIILLS